MNLNALVPNARRSDLQHLHSARLEHKDQYRPAVGMPVGGSIGRETIP